MQVRDTPLRVNERGATVTLSVGAGGSGIYYGPSESSVKTNTAAPGAQVTITSPMYVQSQGLRDGPPADLDVLGGDTTLPSSGSSAVANPGNRWVFAGDSIVNGSNAAAGRNFITLLPGLVGNTSMLPLKPVAGSPAPLGGYSINAGVPGNRSDQLLARWDADVASQNPKGIICLIGTNDTGQLVPLSTYQANVKAIVAKARSVGTPIVFGTIPPRASTDPQAAAITALIQPYNAWLRFYCAQNDIPLAPVYASLVDTTTGYLLAAYKSADDTHPNTLGHLLIARAFATTLAKYFPQAPGIIVTKGQGLATNPLMTGGGAGSRPTGWFEQGGGTGTAPTYNGQVADLTGKLAAGTWVEMDFDATASGGSRTLAHALAATPWAIGDTMLVCGQVDGTDVSGYAAAAQLDPATAGWKLQLTNSTSGVPIGGQQLNYATLTPGVIAVPVTIPNPLPGSLAIWFSCTLPTGAHAKFRLGCADVINLTTLGIDLSAL